MNGAADLDGVLDDVVRNGHTPGFQYVVVDASSTLVEYHGGLADIAAHRPMRVETTMMAYSMSKTITAATVLQLVESNSIRLDDSVAQYLDWQPYPIRVSAPLRRLATAPTTSRTFRHPKRRGLFGLERPKSAASRRSP